MLIHSSYLRPVSAESSSTISELSITTFRGIEADVSAVLAVEAGGSTGGGVTSTVGSGGEGQGLWGALAGACGEQAPSTPALTAQRANRRTSRRARCVWVGQENGARSGRQHRA